MGIIRNILAIAAGFFVGDAIMSDGISNWTVHQFSGSLNPIVVGVAVVGYAAILMIYPMTIKNKPASQCTSQLIAHNSLLAGMSLYLALNIGWISWEIYQTHGLHALVCDSERVQVTYNSLYFYFHIFHLSKFYEFIDTYYLVIRKKPVILLHSWHHITTLILTCATMNSDVAAAWYVILANCVVHVIMYTYYALAADGRHVWWKKYITMMQLGQFISELVLIIPVSVAYKHIAGYDCSGSGAYTILATGILGSFLVLFLRFFSKTYKQKSLI